MTARASGIVQDIIGGTEVDYESFQAGQMAYGLLVASGKPLDSIPSLEDFVDWGEMLEGWAAFSRGFYHESLRRN